MNATAKRQLLADIRMQRKLYALRYHRKHQVFKKLPIQLDPIHLQREYFALIKRTVLADIEAHLDSKLIPRLSDFVRLDAAWDDDINEILDELRDQIVEQFSNDVIRGMLEPIAKSVEQFQSKQLGKQLEAGIGVNPIHFEPYLKGAMENFTRDNVALIKSIPAEFFADLEKKLSAGISDGLRADALSQIIQDATGVAENRAALIARDQIGKFYGNLNQVRQEALGVTAYTWRTVKDNRVREAHEEREGERFQWDDPPEDGAPGEPINCRCWAEPDLEAILNDLE